MKNLLKGLSLMFLFAFASTFAVAQTSTLDQVKSDAGAIIVQSSQIQGQVNVLLQMMRNGNASDVALETRWEELNQSFNELEFSARAMNEGIRSLGHPYTSRILIRKSNILIRHMMLMSDEKVSFNRGNQAAGTRVRKGMQELKNMAQDIRQEVIGMKNN